MLDASEFTTAIHLLQFCLCGNTLPKSLPPDLKPTHLEVVSIDPMTQSQFDAYQRLFDKIARSRNKIPGNIFGIIYFSAGLGLLWKQNILPGCQRILRNCKKLSFFHLRSKLN